MTTATDRPDSQEPRDSGHLHTHGHAHAHGDDCGCDHDHHHHHHAATPIRSVKIGRNEPCPCGSGKKYKKCCLQNG